MPRLVTARHACPCAMASLELAEDTPHAGRPSVLGAADRGPPVPAHGALRPRRLSAPMSARISTLARISRIAVFPYARRHEPSPRLTSLPLSGPRPTGVCAARRPGSCGCRRRPARRGSRGSELAGLRFSCQPHDAQPDRLAFRGCDGRESFMAAGHGARRPRPHRRTGHLGCPYWRRIENSRPSSARSKRMRSSKPCAGARAARGSGRT
jgi:hypothetical protein